MTLATQRDHIKPLAEGGADDHTNEQGLCDECHEDKSTVGARGPKPKPPELAVLEGGRGHRPVDLSAMFRPEVGLPAMPRHLSAEARKAGAG